MKTKYTADYFILKFSKIPDEKWCVNELQDRDGRHCVLGHCEDFPTTTDEADAIWKLFRDCCSDNVVSVNDGTCPAYPQATPKARIMAALRDIKAKVG